MESEVKKVKLNIEAAEKSLAEAEKLNQGPWVSHSKYVAEACRRIAEKCEGMSADDAYIYGILHDIGRYAGVSSEKHLIDGYRYCKARGWDKAAQICITPFVYDSGHKNVHRQVRRSRGRLYFYA